VRLCFVVGARQRRGDASSCCGGRLLLWVCSLRDAGDHLIALWWAATVKCGCSADVWEGISSRLCRSRTSDWSNS
jgi:hypothetical protein